MPAVPTDVNTILSDFTTSLELFKGQLKQAFTSLDLTTVAAILLVVAGAVLLYDLVVYLVASTTTRRSLMMTPLLAQLANNVWENRDEYGISNFIEARSLETAYPILEGLRLAYEKYEHLQ